MENCPVDPQINLRNGCRQRLGDVVMKPHDTITILTDPLLQASQGLVADVIEDEPQPLG